MRASSPDDIYQNLWRMGRPDGLLSDMFNLSRARGGALTVALRILDPRKSHRDNVETSKAASSCSGRGAIGVTPSPSLSTTSPLLQKSARWLGAATCLNDDRRRGPM
jgi:hypothetical protein